jgi:hypothetical protein
MDLLFGVKSDSQSSPRLWRKARPCLVDVGLRNRDGVRVNSVDRYVHLGTTIVKARIGVRVVARGVRVW